MWSFFCPRDIDEVCVLFDDGNEARVLLVTREKVGG